ncbi:hypothetical protein [Branchiibius cervicis]|uniref:Uncharacterized protein n=1 Tax=Branchiibius cervicis TaxID=908252 RepID=A0ABW2ANX3_9MICO
MSTTLEPIDDHNPRCLRRLAGRRCRRESGRTCACSNPLAALDHARCYRFDGSRVVIAAPYSLDAAALDVLAAVCDAEGLAFAVGEPGTGPHAEAAAFRLGGDEGSTTPVVLARTTELADAVAESFEL